MSEFETSQYAPHHDNRTELEKLLLRCKPWLQQNGTTLIYVIAAVLAIAAIVIYSRRIPAGNIEASRALLLAVSPEDFQDVADQFEGTKIGSWARLRQADRLLDNAVSNLFSNRAVGLEELDQAQAAYERLLEQPSLDPEVRERVLIGMARVTENRCDGSADSTTAAVTAWQAVLDEFPGTMIKEHAEKRIADLPNQSTQDFYAWFQKLDPKPAPPTPATNSGMPEVPGIPGLENFGIELPQSTDASPPAVEAEVPADKPAETTDPAAAPKEAAEMKDEAPKADAPKDEAPKADAPKDEAPKADAPKDEAPKADAPKEEAPKADAPKEEAPKADTPKEEAPKADAPKEEAPKADAPKDEAPKADAPKDEAPKADAPKDEAPKADTPKEEAPKADAPKDEAPKADAPKDEAPKADAPKEEAPAAETKENS